MIYTLTREKDVSARDSNVRSGRIGIDLVREFVPSDLNCHLFVCGPGVSTFDRALARETGVDPKPHFLESVLADLKALGVQRGQITYESYG